MSEREAFKDMVKKQAPIDEYPKVMEYYIDEAMDRIERGEEKEIEQLGGGVPTAKSVYFLACKLQAAVNSKQ